MGIALDYGVIELDVVEIEWHHELPLGFWLLVSWIIILFRRPVDILLVVHGLYLDIGVSSLILEGTARLALHADVSLFGVHFDGDPVGGQLS